MGLPAFLSLGGGGLAAGGAANSGLLTTVRSNDPKNCSVRCPRGDGENPLTVTSVMFVGVAAAGIGAGIALLLTEPRASEMSWVPAFRLRVSSQGAGASVKWAF